MLNQFNDKKNIGTYIRMFHKVLASEQLTLLQKLILSDVISFQLDGKQYKRTSKSLAKMLGDYQKATISTNFQILANRGFIITEPDNDGNSEFDLRNVSVVNIEKWVCHDEYLESIDYKESELVPMTKANSKWIQTKINSKESKVKKETNSVEQKLVEATSINEEANEPIQQEVVQEPIQSEKITETNNVDIEINPNIYLEKDEDFNFEEYMTPPKRKSLERRLKSDEFKEFGLNSIDDFLEFNKDGLNLVFKYHDGVWHLLNLDSHKEELLENEHGITYSSHGYGASPTLSSYIDGEKIVSFLISPKALNEYYETKKKDFKDLTNRDFQTLSSFKTDLKLY